MRHSVTVKQAHLNPDCEGCRAAERAMDRASELQGLSMKKIKEQAQALAEKDKQISELEAKLTKYREAMLRIKDFRARSLHETCPDCDASCDHGISHDPITKSCIAALDFDK